MRENYNDSKCAYWIPAASAGRMNTNEEGQPLSRVQPEATFKSVISKGNDPVRVVGIGASAGGMEELKRFFRHVSPDTGFAFAVVHHLSPEHVSLMSDMLALNTSLNVYVAQHGMEASANSIYFCPAQAAMSVRNRQFCLDASHWDESSYPIDHFFYSLAAEPAAQPIAVMFPGAGDDGMSGIAKVKRAGGIVFANREEAAEPLVDSIFADLVLPPEKIADKLNFLQKLVPTGAVPELQGYRQHAPAWPVPVEGNSLIQPAGADTVRRRRSAAAAADNQRQNEIYSIYVNEHMPPSLLLDEHLDVQHVTGSIQPYLSPAEGKPSWNLHKIFDPGLAASIASAVGRLRSGEAEEIRIRNFTIHTAHGKERVHITARPFSRSQAALGGLCLVLFHKPEEEQKETVKLIEPDEGIRRQMQWMEHQLRLTEASLYSAGAELLDLQEELAAAEEELRISRAELQDATEEQEARRGVYEGKIDELTELNGDMDLFLASTGIGAVFLDLECRIRRFTPAATKEFHLMEVDIGRPFHHISHRFYYDGFAADAAGVLESLRSIEREIKSKSGRWYKVRMMPCRTLERLTKGVIITLVDITELKEMNEELLRLSYAVEQSPSLMIISDLEGRIVYANSPFLELTSDTAEGVQERHLEELNDWHASGVAFSELWSQLEDGEIWEGTLAGCRLDGSIYWERAKLLPIVKRGEIIHYMKISENITEWKETEELLRKSEMLGAIGQLAAGIAHEIRNPLTSLKGFTKLMQEDNRRNYISIMAMELERIEQILSELLVLSKPQAADFAVVAIDTVLRDVIMLIEAQAIMNNIQLELHLPEEELYVQGASNQLKQVFINLIKNSIEAMDSGGTILVEATVGEDGMIWTRITDEGSGIPPEKLNKLGEPFFSTKAKGTGLGLVMTYRIVEHHRGKLFYESELGKGTVGNVGLPRMLQGFS